MARTALFSAMGIMFVCALAGACSGGGHGTPTEPPPTAVDAEMADAGAIAPATATRVAPSPTTARPTVSPRTVEIRFEAAAIDTTTAAPGRCWFASIATVGREGSFRCVTGNAISDPCFVGAEQPAYVLCPHDPTDPGDDTVMAADFTPIGEPVPFVSPPRLWFFVTSDGVHCSALTGTRPQTPLGYMSYGCRSGRRGAPGPACAEPVASEGVWTARCFDLDAQRESTRDVATVWY